jgi:hypothetical protein
MKYLVTRFKNLGMALKALEPFIRNGLYLQKGKPFKELSDMRPREAWANWLLCAIGNAIDKNYELNFSSDPTGGDGIIRDNKTGKTWSTEHVFVPKQSVAAEGSSVEELILNAIKKKQTKGKPYATGKTLIVFIDAAGQWFPNRVARHLPRPLFFNKVWVAALQIVEDGSYMYSVTKLDVNCGNAPIYMVHINKDFNSWEVRIIQ